MIYPKPQTVLELFENHPERWTHKTNARNLLREKLSNPHDDMAVCWCLRGAIEFVYGLNSQTFYDAMESVRQVLFRIYKFGAIIEFNDNPLRSFDEILEVIREAGI